jgi:hypothetical protein
LARPRAARARGAVRGGVREGTGPGLSRPRAYARARAEPGSPAGPRASVLGWLCCLQKEKQCVFSFSRIIFSNRV